jgi:hypothetical protein
MGRYAYVFSFYLSQLYLIKSLLANFRCGTMELFAAW